MYVSSPIFQNHDARTATRLGAVRGAKPGDIDVRQPPNNLTYLTSLCLLGREKHVNPEPGSAVSALMDVDAGQVTNAVTRVSA